MESLEIDLKQERIKNKLYLKKKWKVLNDEILSPLKRQFNKYCSGLQICQEFAKLTNELNSIQFLTTTKTKTTTLIEYEIKWEQINDHMNDFKMELEKNKLHLWEGIEKSIIRFDELIYKIQDLTYGRDLNYLIERKRVELKQTCLNLINNIIYVTNTMSFPSYS